MFTIAKSRVNIAAAFAASGLVSVGVPSLAEPVGVSGVEVETSLGATDGSNALALYPTLNTDLQAAIAQRVTGGQAVHDPVVEVSIRKVALDGDTLLPDSKEFNQLEGVVSLSGETGTLSGFSFPVKVSAVSGSSAVPEGYIAVSPSAGQFYVAMVEKFADTVAEKLAEKEVGVPGSK